MKNILKKVPFFLYIALVAFGAYWFYKDKAQLLNPASTHTSPTSTVSRVSFSDMHKKEGGENEEYLIDVTYPRISGIPQDTADAANQLIENFVTTSTENFKTNVADFKREKDMPGSEFRVDYTVTALNDKIVSFEFNVYEYMSGAAHPNGFVHTFNYDVKNNRVINALQDIFVPGSNYLQTISELSRADLKDQLKENISPDEIFEEGTAPTEENFREFVVTTHGLKIIFNPYQIGPYALGGQEVLIPYEKLQTLLPVNSVLLNFK